MFTQNTRSDVRHRKVWPLFVLLAVLIVLFTSSILLIIHFTSQTSTQEELTPDTTAPVFSTESQKLKFFKGDSYTLPDIVATDDRDKNIEITKTGTIDNNELGTYEVIYSATDSAGNTSSITITVDIIEKQTGVIYLTFDDGPEQDTERLLDVLKKYNVKATFFVTGRGNDNAIKRAYEDGHSIGLHTWSHNYSYIYQNMSNFFADLNQVQERVKRITGQESKLIRFPGGSSNVVSKRYDGGTKIMSKLAVEVEKRGYSYFDWNIDSDDAGSARTSDQVYNNVISSLKSNGNSVVLQHDIKGFSVDAVERIIQYADSKGYTFKALSTDSYSAHHRISN